VFIFSDFDVNAFEIPDKISVGLDSFDVSEVIIDNKEIYLGYDGKFSECALYCNNSFKIYILNEDIILNIDGVDMINLNDNFQIKANDCLKLNSKRYRGILEFYKKKIDLNYKLKIINLLSCNEYLYGVVCSEMPHNWPEQALKAQAVAARTYLLSSINNKTHKDFDICDKVHCQVYKGLDSEYSRVNDFIDETENKCIVYNDKIINAYFFSSSGGNTDDVENVWGNKIDYLIGIDDKYESECKIWKCKFSKNDIQEILDKKNIDLGEIIDLSIDEINKNNRVNKILISGSKSNLILSKQSIINFFNSIKTGFLSRNFYIEKNDTSDGFEIIFNGKGYGHGVGMSQYGAKGMSDSGFNFIEILKFYYTGVEIANS
jgi:stage II sporulation protein D